MNRSALSALEESDIENLRRALWFILKNSADVEDVIQDAYVRVLEYSQSSSQIDNPVAFLHRVARNLAIDHIRWRQRTARIYVAPDDSEHIRSQVQNVHSHERRADEMLEQDQALEAVLNVVSKLPPKCRDAYLLSRIEERTYREISARVGLSVSMIEKYVLRACRQVAAIAQPTQAMTN
jgi:RNA polymerase sigma factor (sigma-70 family)